MKRSTSFKENALALYAIQGLQYLTPLLVLPVLTRQLGSEQFGLLAYWQSLIGGLGLLIDYGFNYSAVRAVSNAEGQSEILGKIYRSTTIARLILFALAALLLFGIPQLITGARPDLAMQCLGLSTLAGIATSPAWYLTGLKRVIPLAYASTISAACVITATWLFVSGPHSLYTAAAIQFIAPLITACLAQWMLRKYAPPPKVTIRATDVIGTLRAGAPLFLMSISAGIYSTLNPFFLGLVASSTQVAYFSLGERLARAARSALSPITIAIFPYAATHDNKQSDQLLLKKTSLALLVLASLIAMTLGLLSPWFIPLYFGKTFSPSIFIAQILSLNIAIITASNLLGVQYLIAREKDKIVLNITLWAVPIHLLAFLIAAKIYGALGGAITYVATESLVTSALLAAAIKTRRPSCI
jgi:polysaccharide transporter, PST family